MAVASPTEVVLKAKLVANKDRGLTIVFTHRHTASDELDGFRHDLPGERIVSYEIAYLTVMFLVLAF